MQKRERQTALLSLIRTESISSQSDLVTRLTEIGFSVTQASVSRDLDELRVTKRSGSYGLAVTEDPIPEFRGVRFDTAGDCLIVGRCASGLASAIAVRIDAAGIGEIVGTIAGDDTIFIAIKDRDAQITVLGLVAELFERQ